MPSLPAKTYSEIPRYLLSEKHLDWRVFQGYPPNQTEIGTPRRFGPSHRSLLSTR
jgi:hypothetical protein